MNRNDTATLAYVAGALRTVEAANAWRGRAATARLVDAGLIARHPEWTGCLTLTERGSGVLDSLDPQ